MKVGIPGLLFVALVVLKLAGIIDWSWWWVASPLWVSFIGYFLIIFALFVYRVVTD